MRNMFCRITVDSWNDLLSLFDKLTNKVSDWAFRGQSDDNWGLSSKFEREAKNYHCESPYWFKNREHYILQDFQRRAHHYVEKVPKSENCIEWLSLLQHYGGPTRLLDFTYSSYVALFFAVETSAVNSAAIWAVNIGKLIRQLYKVENYSSIKEEHTYEEVVERNNQWAETIIKDRKNNDVVLLVDPFQQHERISAQQGLFLFPGNIDKSFEYNICSFFELGFIELSDKNALCSNVLEIDESNIPHISVAKIIIPSSLHSKVLFELHKMNVTAASLFPGLDGFARSLSYRFGKLDYFLHTKDRGKP